MNGWQDGPVTLHLGDATTVLSELPTASVHCVVTSPPYYGLRDYGTGAWQGGDPGCDHKGRSRSHRDGVTHGAAHGEFGESRGTQPAKVRHELMRQTCRKCGAVRLDEQIGLEGSLDAYLERLVAVFREVRRVLRPDGTLWLNMGDCYVADGGHGWGNGASRLRAGRSYPKDAERHQVLEAGRSRTLPGAGLKRKDLVGLPWRVAFALQADGWYLRSDIVWSKPNPMPSSATDRPTSAHEYLFLLSPRPRYFYDGEAVKTPLRPDTKGASFATMDFERRDHYAAGAPAAHRHTTKMPDGWDTGPGGHGKFHRHGREKGKNAATGATLIRGGDRYSELNARYDAAEAAGTVTGANLRTVWTIAPQPYGKNHFATFPEALVIPCIKAGTSERGVCGECGAPWRRMTATRYVKSPAHGEGSIQGRRGATGWNVDGRITAGASPPRVAKDTATTGWEPTCGHFEAPDPMAVPLVPAVVLDPFAGSGTTLAVARRLGRRAVGIELQPDYLPLIQQRVCEAALPLVELVAASAAEELQLFEEAGG